MRISDWSSYVCSSDLLDDKGAATVTTPQHAFKRQACRRRIESIPEIALTCPGDGVECAAQDGPMRTMLDLTVDAVAGCPLADKPADPCEPGRPSCRQRVSPSV